MTGAGHELEFSARRHAGVFREQRVPVSRELRFDISRQSRRRLRVASRQHDQAQISDLSGRIGQLQEQNNQLNAALAKVQAEEQRQVTENDLLAKVLEQAKLTGKIPDKLPYPPK